MTVRRLETNPIHLGPLGRAVSQPAFTGPDWYERYDARHGSDGADGRLVSQFTFSESWDSWEMHPYGEEVVLCLAGRLTLIQEDADGAQTRISLEPGGYAINPPGIWHLAYGGRGGRGDGAVHHGGTGDGGSGALAPTPPPPRA